MPILGGRVALATNVILLLLLLLDTSRFVGTYLTLLVETVKARAHVVNTDVPTVNKLGAAHAAFPAPGVALAT